MGGYVGWARWRRTWQAASQGDTVEACYRVLLAAIRASGRVPVESAVLPVGTHPASKQEGVGS